MRKLFAALALSVALAAGSTPAMAQQAEFSEEEVSALARFAMPRALQGVQQRCRAELPADAYIFARGPALLTRLQTASRNTWPTARGAILRLVQRENPDMAPLLRQMPAESLQPFAEEMVAGMVVSKIEAGSCGRIDRVLSLLDPLPAENLASLIGLAFVEAQASGQIDRRRLGGF